MKITSWNVNGIRAATKKGFLDFLAQDNPDILCIQETKAEPEQLTEELISPLNYMSYWSSAIKKGYSGTAIFSKKKIDVQYMNIQQFDNEGRVLVADIGYAILINAYFPNSQDQGKRLDYKLEFCDAMLNFCNSLQKSKPIILCGDYNIAHKEIDLARPKENETSPGYLPEERAWMDTFTQAGYVDTFRAANSNPDNYTWWSYRAKARERNVGWRIDYFCISPLLQKKVTQSNIQSDVYGSDHCPISLELR